MKRYDYREALATDIKEAICENTFEEIKEWILNDREAYEEDLFDDLWNRDSVTGNASGSYTFNTYEAEENIVHNFDLLEEAAEEFGIAPVIKSGWECGAEWWDVTIRCYLLRSVLAEVLDEIEKELQ